MRQDELFRSPHPSGGIALVTKEPGRLEGQNACGARRRESGNAAVMPERKGTDHKVQLFTGGTGAVVTYFFPTTVATVTLKQIPPCQALFFLVME